jgi:UDP-glucose 4-epimerase
LRILVTGGAGYVGSHAVDLLLRHGHEIVVYDNLSHGHTGAVPEEILVQAELADGAGLAALLAERRIEAVMHFAAFSLVGESVADPALYYRNNIEGTLSLLGAMRSAGTSRVVFSSSCAIYGEPDTVPIREDTPQRPVNPYGFTKLAMERALADYARAYGFGYAALRYFNACGASPDGRLGEDHDPETHAIPLLLATALGQLPCFTLFGDDYPTPDGTCIRDYVHVDDLAEAHLLALDRIEAGQGAASAAARFPWRSARGAPAIRPSSWRIRPGRGRCSTGGPGTPTWTGSSRPPGAGIPATRTASTTESRLPECTPAGPFQAGGKSCEFIQVLVPKRQFQLKPSVGRGDE